MIAFPRVCLECQRSNEDVRLAVTRRRVYQGVTVELAMRDCCRRCRERGNYPLVSDPRHVSDEDRQYALAVNQRAEMSVVG